MQASNLVCSEPQYRIKFRVWKLSKNMRSMTRKGRERSRRGSSVLSVQPTYCHPLRMALDCADKYASSPNVAAREFHLLLARSRSLV